LETRVWKSREQNDVTPSVIYVGSRGNRLYGTSAYNNAVWSPDNVAQSFKRLMGTSTPIVLSAVGLSMTPEECSAEILKVLYGYLPEEIRSHPDVGTVVTVPAAFNQMQKDATMQAARMAGIGNVALMQEPVAAVMSVVRARRTDGLFLVYDLGGGTLDVAVAESIGGRVSLLSHGGKAMCGGRDLDRILVDNVIRPWLLKTFRLPDDFSINPDFKPLARSMARAAEQAKIELSAREQTAINLDTEGRFRDLDGNEIYFDIPLLRTTYDKLIADLVNDTTDVVRETLTKSGLPPDDVERIVFIGGPTNYKPLRDKVALELGIPGSTEVNPMTAVAEGASLFAESIDWSSQQHSRKSSSGRVSPASDLKLSFSFVSRTPGATAKILANLTSQAPAGYEFQIDSLDTGWTSGRLPLQNGATVEVVLSRSGENTFKVFLLDVRGGPVALEQDRIVITRTAATVDAIPASHSIAIEVLDQLGGQPVLDFLVKAGDPLPCKGNRQYKAAESLKAGAQASLNFKLWEGDIGAPISDNRPIGVMKISGSDFADGVIPAGGELQCEYEVLDSGNIFFQISIPSIRGTFASGKNFYSRQEGQLDYSSSSAYVVEQGQQTLDRIDAIGKVVDDPKLERARWQLEAAVELDPEKPDAEMTQEAMESVHEARRILAQVRQEHLKEIRQVDLDGVVKLFNEHVREHARTSETTAFDNLAKTMQRSIDRSDSAFEHQLDELRGKNFAILWRQDWFVVHLFKSMTDSPHLFADRARFEELSRLGTQLMRSDDIDKLRDVVAQLHSIQIGGDTGDEIMDIANIVRG
jgi:molecular chaperone DnaK